MVFELTDKVQVDRDDQGKVQQLEHFAQPVVAVQPGGLERADTFDAPIVAAATPQALAAQYLREVAPIYQFDQRMLADQSGGDAAFDDSDAPSQQGKLELFDEKEVMGTTVVSYQQTYDGMPVWEAGASVTIQPQPMRVTASQSSVHADVSLPDEPLGDASYDADAITPTVLKKLLGVRSRANPTINETRQLIYQFDPEQRFDPEARQTEPDVLQEAPPTLPLPDVPDAIVAGDHYQVTEVLFTLSVTDYGAVNWRAFIEPTTGAVLYLRAFVACATGMIFRTDPVTAGAGAVVTPTASAATLNPFRSSVVLDGLTAGNPQPLAGDFVRLVESEQPAVVPPTSPNPPASFAFDATAREFAAVNAYHHCDWLFRHLQDMGFNLATYFDGTTFPVPVDACAFGDIINARAPGNVTGRGSGGFSFGLAGAPFPAVSIAADLRVVLHEFGHTVLWDSVHSPNFGFAHSAGDSFAAIHTDPESSLRTDPIRRFETFPWVIPNRDHGRAVADGWGWGGLRDVGSYSSEQILSTTHFRLYRALGGDAVTVNQRKLASRQTLYLIFRAIGSLASNPVTPTTKPDVFANALQNADIGTIDFEGYRGGTFHKVIRWSFEKQGLYQPPGAPSPVRTPGAPPKVDVYIDDGRRGEYAFQPRHWECTDIWNRLAPSPGGGAAAHQTPVVGQTNFAYVRAHNRGTQQADNVVVRGYSANPGAGLTWPGDWRPMDTADLAVIGGIAPNTSVVVGPFRWHPRTVGHECMLMEATADGDFSNIDPRTFLPCATGPTAEWRLVPFDNNLGQRGVTPVPGGGGVLGLLSGFVQRRFEVHNPFDAAKQMVVNADVPPFLADLGWGVNVDHNGAEVKFGLPGGGMRLIEVGMLPGSEFTREQLAEAGPQLIRVDVSADGIGIGGMTYQVDPDLTRAPKEHDTEDQVPLDHPSIREALREARERDMATGDVAATAETEEAVPDTERPRPEHADSGAAIATDSDAGRLLAQLGLTAQLRERIHRIRVREITVDIELDQ